MFGRFVYFPKIHTIFDNNDDSYVFIVFIVDTFKSRQCHPKGYFYGKKHNKCVFVELTCNLGQSFYTNAMCFITQYWKQYWRKQLDKLMKLGKIGLSMEYFIANFSYFSGAMLSFLMAGWARSFNSKIIRFFLFGNW